jgi:hypothetical protein
MVRRTESICGIKVHWNAAEFRLVRILPFSAISGRLEVPIHPEASQRYWQLVEEDGRAVIRQRDLDPTRPRRLAKHSAEFWAKQQQQLESCDGIPRIIVEEHDEHATPRGGER